MMRTLTSPVTLFRTIYGFHSKITSAIQRPCLFKMSSSSDNGNPNKTPKVQALQAIIKETNSWEKSWANQVTPWDIGGVTPIIADLVHKNDLPMGRALVPGCGTGYDVLALASPSRHVVGLDISQTAITKATEALTKENSISVEFICADFFSYQPSAPFNLIFDYTFFCALEPSLRPLWASKVSELLDIDGELITLMFPVDIFEGGPPYAVSRELYEQVLSKHGFQCVVFKENGLAVDRRKGREFLGRWRRIKTKL